MVKKDLAAVISGISLMLIGFILFIVSFFAWPVIFYALFCWIVGIVILLNSRKGDEIEQIKTISLKTKKSKK